MVNRHDGSLIPTGTAHEVGYFIEQWESRQAWRRAASERDLLTSDAVEELAVIGPTMKVPVAERLRSRHPQADPAALDDAAARSVEVGEEALAATRTLRDQPAATDALAERFPRLYRPALQALVHRARYWWTYEI